MYVPSALDFDGSSDYLTRGAGLTGAADGKVGLISFWFQIDGGDGSTRYLIAADTGRFYLYLDTSDRFRFYVRNASHTLIYDQVSVSYVAGANWRNFLASWDLSNAKAYIYVDDTSVGAPPGTITDDNIDYTGADYGIGARHTGVSTFNGALAEFYFNSAEYLDISVEANRRKFITAALKPEDLGTDGSTSTGTAPIVYMKFAEGAHGTNSGTGGNFTETGAPADTIGPVTPRQARARGASRPKSRRL